jgi:hypothetical protein
VVDAELHAFSAALPFALLMCAVSLLVTRPLARRARIPTLLALAYALAVSGFVVVTLTPTGGGTFFSSWSRRVLPHLIRSMDLALPSFHDLTSLNEVSLNIIAAAPMGLLTALAVIRARRLVLGVSVLVPPCCELVQALLPHLNRVGFVLSDVINNEIGFAAGAALGVLMALAGGLGRGTRGTSYARRREESPAV